MENEEGQNAQTVVEEQLGASRSMRDIFGAATVGFALATFGMGVYESTKAALAGPLNYSDYLMVAIPAIPTIVSGGGWIYSQSVVDTLETVQKLLISQIEVSEKKDK